MPAVLLTNDDGPPSNTDSPYVLGLYRLLTALPGWHVKVVLPSSQKSWIGKAYHIKEVTKGVYFYPKEDGKGERSAKSRPLKDGEIGEWILLDGTPATCANVALHNLFPGQIDLVISGPNLGRNTSAAFSLSSGTIGAALSSSLSKTRAIAISYATVLHPTPPALYQPAHTLACAIVNRLWQNWGKDEGGLRNGEVDLYSVNIPLIEQLLSETGLQIYSTRMYRNSYGRLFKPVAASDHKPLISPAGPDSLVADQATEDDEGDLMFKFKPDMEHLISPSLSSLPEGSDAWAIHHGHVSVTPLRASFAEPPTPDTNGVEDRIWKMKL